MKCRNVLALWVALACAAPAAGAFSKNEEKALFIGTLLGAGLATRALILRDQELRHGAASPPLDRRLFDAVQRVRRPALEAPVQAVNLLGDGRFVFAASAAASLWGSPKARRAGRTALVSFAAAASASEGLKRLIGRPRPKNPEDRRSMPSGHTTNAFAAAAALSAEYPARKGLLYGLAAGVGFSRVYLGRHYPSDAFAGALLGTASARLVWGRRAAVLDFTF